MKHVLPEHSMIYVNGRWKLSLMAMPGLRSRQCGISVDPWLAALPLAANPSRKGVLPKRGRSRNVS
jgi:hypothetical protein